MSKIDQQSQYNEKRRATSLAKTRKSNSSALFLSTDATRAQTRQSALNQRTRLAKVQFHNKSTSNIIDPSLLKKQEEYREHLDGLLKQKIQKLMLEKKTKRNKKATNEIINKITDELGAENTKKYINYIDMSMLQEEYSIGQTLTTAQILQEIDHESSDLIKKYYNYKLTNWLQAQET